MTIDYSSIGIVDTVGVQIAQRLEYGLTRRTPASITPKKTTRRLTAPSTEESAKEMSLRFVNDAMPGYTRTRHGGKFTFLDIADRAIHDAPTVARLRSLAIPPAWTGVWIAPSANGHIQATGRDAKGRKQYRYHSRWQAVRAETKYARMQQFGAALPEMRSRVSTDLGRREPGRDKVLAVVVRLLETTYIRVGNEEYARTNGSFGLTTLRNRHALFSGNTLRLEFIGKMGKPHSIRVTDRRMARLVRQCRDLPGQALFQYRDDRGATIAIESTDVNAYIREISGDDFTAKDFRTWAGSLLAASQIALTTVDDNTSASERAGAMKAAIVSVANQLGNTPAVCKSNYIHPRVLAALNDVRVAAEWLTALHGSRARTGLTREESTLLAFLDDR